MSTFFEIRGAKLFKGLLAADAQAAIVEDVRKIVLDAPLVAPVTPGGRQMSVKMTAAGRLGWVTDHRGYRYQPTHPTGRRWPAIPDSVLSIWQKVSDTDREPDCCLVNFYDAHARMGLHQDRDEGDFSYPVVSVSLGDDALFRLGGIDRKDPTQSFWLSSGDVLVLGGASRLAWHGIDKVRHGSSALLPKGGRINLTLRVVDKI